MLPEKVDNFVVESSELAKGVWITLEWRTWTLLPGCTQFLVTCNIISVVLQNFRWFKLKVFDHLMCVVVFSGNIIVFGLILYYVFVVKKQMYGILNSSILSRVTLCFALCGIYSGFNFLMARNSSFSVEFEKRQLHTPWIKIVLHLVQITPLSVKCMYPNSDFDCFTMNKKMVLSSLSLWTKVLQRK